MTAQSTQSSSPDATIVQIDDRGVGLYAQCVWKVDRFTFEVGPVIDGERFRCISSVEGDAEDIWPCSPPMQQIHKQEIDGNPTLLAVGMSGKSHYSVSMLLAMESSGIQLTIESACRTSLPTVPEIRLGSRIQIESNYEYCINEMMDRLEVSDSRVPMGLVLEVDSPQCLLQKKSPNQVELSPAKINQPGTTQWNCRFFSIH